MPDISPENRYWLAADGRVFSFQEMAVIPPDDPAYLAWAEAGGIPTEWPRNKGGAQTEVEMRRPLAPYNVSMSLDTLKANLKVQVDAAAENKRLSLITPGSGQAMEYQEAYAQAQAALAAAGPVSAADYPMLAATVGIDIDPRTRNPSTDVLGVARSVKAAYEAYLAVGAAIRGIRLGGKAAIDAAADADAAQAAYAAIAWPSFG